MGESGEEGEVGVEGEEEASHSARRIDHIHFVSPEDEREWPWYLDSGGAGGRRLGGRGPSSTCILVLHHSRCHPSLCKSSSWKNAEIKNLEGRVVH